MNRIYIYILLFSFVIVSCTKSSEEKKIIGSWEYQFFSENVNNTTITWTFNDDQTMDQLYSNGSYKDTATASFNIDGNFPQVYYVTISGIDIYNDGKYQILKLNKKYLILERVEYDGKTEGVFLRKEFVKK